MPDPQTPPKQRQQRETRLVADFVSAFYPDDRAIFNLRVGGINPLITDQDLTEGELALIGSHRRYADAVVIRDRDLVLIEGYILPTLGKVSQILGYRALLPLTPELGAFASLPITAIIVGPIEDQFMARLARESGIQVRVYRPPWIEEFLNGLSTRHRRVRLDR